MREGFGDIRAYEKKNISGDYLKKPSQDYIDEVVDHILEALWCMTKEGHYAYFAEDPPRPEAGHWTAVAEGTPHQVFYMDVRREVPSRSAVPEAASRAMAHGHVQLGHRLGQDGGRAGAGTGQ